MDINLKQRRLEEVSLDNLKVKILEAEEDIKNNRVHSAHLVFKELNEKYGF